MHSRRPSAARVTPLRLTLVIPARDEVDRLPRCLASVAAQTRPADEVVVVDNGSTDATARIAAAAGARVVYESEVGIWPAAAAGYDAATGDVIARVDADTVLPPGWLARVEELLVADPTCDAVTGPGRFRGLGRPSARVAQLCYMQGYFLLAGMALGGPPVFGSAFAVRAGAWREVRLHVHRDADVHDDLDLSFHLRPGAIRYDEGLAVSISSRPFDSRRGMLRRVARGWRSVVLHWPQQGPWRLAGDRVLARAGAVRDRWGRVLGRVGG